MFVRKKPSFSFINTITAHGWVRLAPFEFDEELRQVGYAVDLQGHAADILMKETANSIKISVSSEAKVPRGLITGCVKHMLRIDEKFEEFHRLVSGDPGYRWIAERRFGPMLRSATVFEDLVKTICTTNCSWGLTRAMVRNLVDCLGKESDSGRRAFPGPDRMAAEGDGFYSEKMRAGYRGPYLRELAQAAASGAIDPESWLDSDLPTTELKREIKKIKGVGDYAAEHLLKLIGRYDGLALDSFLRSCFYKSYNRGKPCADKTIESHYRRFGSWKGLVMWFEMVEKAEQRSREKAAGATP